MTEIILKFDEEQYQLLKECSDNGDMTKWNNYREDNSDKPVYLEGANLQGTNLTFANLQGAQLFNSKLQDANLQFANLIGASLFYAELQGADLMGAELQGAELQTAKLQGAYLDGAKLQGAKLQAAILNESTDMYACTIDQQTDFRDTALDSIRISSRTKYLLKYNIRRLNWEDWYNNHHYLQWLTKPFWLLSDYGISTLRIFITFVSLAFLFALIYWENSKLVIFNNNINIDNFQSLWHACYFSIVTMTTLGFGDIAANPNSWQGQGMLMLQVILGYVLLGALITRLAILFTSDGPAGSFSPMDKKTKEFLAKIKQNRQNKANEFLERKGIR